MIGKVLGFTIEWEGQTNGCIHISVDTVLFDGVYELAQKKKVDIAILHLGAGAFPYLKKNLRVIREYQSISAMKTYSENRNTLPLIPHFADKYDQFAYFFIKY